MIKDEFDKSLLTYDKELPEEYTIPKDNIPPVHNQHLDTTSYQCMAFATSGITRIFHKLWTGEDIRFSVAFIYGAYRRESNRTGLPMFVSDLIPGLVNGGAIPFDAMPDLKKPAECYDYVKAHPELIDMAKPYADMFKGYINLKDKTKLKTFENIKKALLKYKLPLYGEMVGHGIIFCGFKGEYILYRDSDGSNFLKKLHYKDVKEGFVFILNNVDNNVFPFTDVPKTHWAYKPIKSCYDTGVMKGVTASQFQPNKSFSRAEAAQTIMNLIKTKNIKINSINGGTPYTDVTSLHWACEAIKFCYNTGIMKGIGPFTFAPDKELTRAEAAQLIVNLIQKINIKIATTNTTIPFNDISQEHWAYDAVQYCYKVGVMKGTSQITFEPNKSLTRAEAAQLMENVIKIL